MIRLAFLLLGTNALRPQWRILAVAGALWGLLGFAILYDLQDGQMGLLGDALAILLIVEGVLELVVAAALGLRRSWRRVLRGVVFLAAAFLTADVPWDDNIGSTILLGSAFLADGALRIASAFVVHGPRWRRGLAAGAAEIAISALIFLDHPIPHRLTVPFCIALILIFSGYALLAMSLQLRRLAPGASVTSLPLYASWEWHGRPEIDLAQAAGGPEFPGQTLTLRVWTAMGAAEGAHGQPVVRRYIAAVDRDGVVSTGHAALELPPDLYISHYPATEIDRDGDHFREALDAGVRNNVPGLFQPSYAQEAAAWREADQSVAFSRFNAAALRAFWSVYAQDKTYNLTARNCSTTAIVALDAAVEGVMNDGRPIRALGRLLVNPDFWLLRLARGRAELMTWTPGLALDYARLLRQVIEDGDRRWIGRLAAARRLRRVGLREVEE